MKALKYMMLVALLASNNPLIGMNALRKKQVDVVQEQKAAKTFLNAFHIHKNDAQGIDTDDSDLVLTDIEQRGWLNIPTPEALQKLLSLKMGFKKEEIIVEEMSEARGARNIGLFKAYRANYKTAKHKGAKGEIVGGDIIKKHPLFFLKISGSSLSGITEKLNALQKGPVGRFGLKAISNPDLPIIVLQEKFFTYKDKNNNDYIIEVMHLAHGKPIFEIMDSRMHDQQQWGEKIGKALGLFHIEFMQYNNSDDPTKWRTMVHGDFHIGNVFFDEKKSRVYFIDNAQMTIDAPWGDLYFVCRLIPRGIFEAINEAKGGQYNGKGQSKLKFFLYFIQGYLDAYPADKRIFMAQCIKKELANLRQGTEFTANEVKERYRVFDADLDKVLGV